jgi:hypothetical protein
VNRGGEMLDLTATPTMSTPDAAETASATRQRA